MLGPVRISSWFSSQSSSVSFGMNRSSAASCSMTGMPALDDPEQVAVDDHGPCIIVLGRGLGERNKAVDDRQPAGHVLDPDRRGRDRFPHLLEQPVLQVQDLLFRAQDLLLVLLQLRRDEPLGVGQRLLADIVLRHVREIRLGDLDIVAEDPVVAHLERIDAGPLPLALLDGRDPALAFGADACAVRPVRRCSPS